jgi:hypothetical protein
MPAARTACSIARIALERHRPARGPTRALALAVLITGGFVLASAVAGCGSSGNTSTRAESLSLTKPTVDRPTTTREAVVTRTETTPTQTRTVQQTQTLQQTVTAPPPTTSAQLTVTQASSSSSTPAWVWALVAAVAVGAIALVVWLVSGRSHRPSPEERRRSVAATVQSWVGQGWAIENQTENSTVLRRNGQRMVLTFDADGRLTSSPLGSIGEGPVPPSA